MDEDTRRKVEANLFPAARLAVEPWDQFRWHLDRHKQCDTWKPHSSQALAIDVFGWLKVIEQEERDVICSAIADTLKLPQAKGWHVELEWVDPRNRLQEHPKHPTQVDAVFRSPSTLISCECKFAESDGGECSQTATLKHGVHRGKTQCNGVYTFQVNPVNQKSSRCSLTAKGIRYWAVIPHVFELGADEDHVPCPFAGSWYQWMRNIVLSRQMATDAGIPGAFLIVYADSPCLPFARKVRSSDGLGIEAVLRSTAITFKLLAYQSLLQVALAALQRAGMDTAECEKLIEWVEVKIASAAAMFASSD